MSEFLESSPSHALWRWVLLGSAAGVLVGAVGTWWLVQGGKAQAPTTAAAPAPKKKIYQCPMHLQILQDHPGTCPLCAMDLVLVEDGGEPDKNSPGQVVINAERQQLMGLRTVLVEEGSTGGEVRANARLVVDETRVRKVSVKVEGFVEKLYVDFLGKPVAKGEPLFALYSPEFVSAQQELLLALRTQGAMTDGALKLRSEALVEAARRRLTYWDVPADTIAELERSGTVSKSLILASPIAGVVTAKNILEGGRLAAGDSPVEVTDLSHLWALVEVYEPELARVKVGQGAELKLQGRVIRGRVAFIDPLLDPKTRTAKVRLELANPNGELKPDMYGEAILRGPAGRGLTVPLDAVLDSGTAKVVFLALGNGRFEPREIRIGTTSGDRVEVKDGLQLGDQVVTRAAFLVDSESRLRVALADMGAKTDAHAH